MVAHTGHLRPRNHFLRPRKPVVYGCGLHRPGVTITGLLLQIQKGKGKLFGPTDHGVRASRVGRQQHSDHHGVFNRCGEILQEMSHTQTRPDTPLLDMWPMCVEDGPPLSLAVHLSRSPQLQGLCTVSDLHIPLCLGQFRRFGLVDVEGNVRGKWVSGRFGARQHHPPGRDFGDYRIGVDRVYGVAYLSVYEGADHD